MGEVRRIGGISRSGPGVLIEEIAHRCWHIGGPSVRRPKVHWQKRLARSKEIFEAIDGKPTNPTGMGQPPRPFAVEKTRCSPFGGYPHAKSIAALFAFYAVFLRSRSPAPSFAAERPSKIDKRNGRYNDPGRASANSTMEAVRAFYGFWDTGR